jgi:hypothetical protein
MTTAYAIADTLPKDLGGAKFAAYINDEQLDAQEFAMPRGIAVEQIGTASQNMAHLAVGSHTAGSEIQSDSAGMVLLGKYAADIAAISNSVAQPMRVDNQGNLYTTGCAVGALTPDSNVLFTGSGIVYSATVAFDGATAGDTWILKDNGTDVVTVVANNTNETVHLTFPQGQKFSTHCSATRSISGGATSINISYTQF